MDRQEFNQETLNQSLHSEDVDEILRLASREEFLKSKGFNHKEYSRIFNKPYTEADSAIGPALPARYYSDDDFSSSGAMPPPKGSYNQEEKAAGQAAKKQKEPQTYSNIFSDLVRSVKMNLYIDMVQLPIDLRDLAMRKVNSWGKMFDFISSAYQMGADCGPLQSMIADFLYDRVELILNEADEILSIRIYNGRKESALNKFLREDSPIPFHGRMAQKDDLDYTPGGTVVYKLPRCGGKEYNVEDLTFDSSYEKSGTLRWATHGDIDIKGIDSKEVKGNLIEFALSHYVYTHKEMRQELQRHPESGEMIYRMTLPRGYSPHNWDAGLAKDTLIQTFVGATALHLPFRAISKMYEYFGLEEKYSAGVHQRELNAQFIPRYRVISKGR